MKTLIAYATKYGATEKAARALSEQLHGDEDRAEEQLEQNFDAALVAHAVQRGYFGYEYDFTKMNILFRWIIRAKAKVRQSQYKLREDNISSFAETLNGSVARTLLLFRNRVR